MSLKRPFNNTTTQLFVRLWCHYSRELSLKDQNYGVSRFLHGEEENTKDWKIESTNTGIIHKQWTNLHTWNASTKNNVWFKKIELITNMFQRMCILVYENPFCCSKISASCNFFLPDCSLQVTLSLTSYDDDPISIYSHHLLLPSRALSSHTFSYRTSLMRQFSD